MKVSSSSIFNHLPSPSSCTPALSPSIAYDILPHAVCASTHPGFPVSGSTSLREGREYEVRHDGCVAHTGAYRSTAMLPPAFLSHMAPRRLFVPGPPSAQTPCLCPATAVAVRHLSFSMCIARAELTTLPSHSDLTLLRMSERTHRTSLRQQGSAWLGTTCTDGRYRHSLVVILSWSCVCTALTATSQHCPRRPPHRSRQPAGKCFIPISPSQTVS